MFDFLKMLQGAGSTAPADPTGWAGGTTIDRGANAGGLFKTGLDGQIAGFGDQAGQHMGKALSAFGNGMSEQQGAATGQGAFAMPQAPDPMAGQQEALKSFVDGIRARASQRSMMR